MKRKRIFQISALFLIGLFAVFFSACGFFGGAKVGDRKLFPVKKDGKYGYMDKSGKVVIEPQFDRAYDFYEGLARVDIYKKSNSAGSIQYEDVKSGYIDETGKIVIEPQYQSGGRFSEGVAVFPSVFYKPDGETSYAPQKTIAIDKTGKVLFELDSNHMAEGGFSDGLLLVKIKEPQENWQRTKGTKFKYGYVDKTGKFVIESKEWFSAEPFSEGLASVAVYKSQNYSGDAYYGFIDTSGKMAIETKYKETGSFHEGLARASKDGKEFGFIDKDENWVGGGGYEAVSDFRDGVVVIPGYKHFRIRGKTLDDVFVTVDGTILTDFSENLAVILDDKNKLQIIDKNGKTIAPVDESLPPTTVYFDQEGFQGGLIRGANKSDYKTFYIDNQGKLVWSEMKN